MTLDKKFIHSFRKSLEEDSGLLSSEYLLSMYNYIVNGFPPGGMFTAIIANDIVSALRQSYPANDWNQLIIICKWLNYFAPPACWGSYESVDNWGSYESVDNWCALTQNERRTILKKANIVSTAWDILNK